MSGRISSLILALVVLTGHQSITRMAGLRPPAGFPTMTETAAFLMKDLVLFAVSFYLLKQDVVRASLSGKRLQGSLMSGQTSAWTSSQQNT
jgi:hypothetical protein